MSRRKANVPYSAPSSVRPAMIVREPTERMTYPSALSRSAAGIAAATVGELSRVPTTTEPSPGVSATGTGVPSSPDRPRVSSSRAASRLDRTSRSPPLGSTARVGVWRYTGFAPAFSTTTLLTDAR